MISFSPMAPHDTQLWLEESAEAYAAESAKASGISHTEALAKTRALLADLLPRGVNTDGHLFRWVEDGAERIGKLWVGPRPGDDQVVHIWDIEIDTEFQGLGYGGAAIDLLTAESREKGANSLTLNVFEDNPGAKRLYERKGFRVIVSNQGQTAMSLELG